VRAKLALESTLPFFDRVYLGSVVADITSNHAARHDGLFQRLSRSSRLP